MKTLAVTVVLGLSLLVGYSPGEAVTPESMLLSRQLLATVSFAHNASVLDPEARQLLDETVARLMPLASGERLLRIEGFASADGHSAHNVLLSMRRALAVQSYLLKRHQLEVEIYLTGFGADHDSAGAETARRADLFLYEDTLGLLSAPVLHVVTSIDDLPSR